MKKIIFSIILILAVLSVNAQNKQILRDDRSLEPKSSNSKFSDSFACSNVSRCIDYSS